MPEKDLPDKASEADVQISSGEEKIVSVVRQDFTGPLPHPSILAGYDQVVPGSAERILVMAEKQLEHRIETESFLVKEQMNRLGRGQHYALIICLSALIVALILGLTGHETSAAIIGGLDLAALAAVFVIGRPLAETKSTPQPSGDEKAEEVPD